MSGFPVIDQLAVELGAGRGVAVILEGDSSEDDPWFYGQWFGGLASKVTFYPQDGWTQVVKAVAELRRLCSGVPIYGIIDRDFCEEPELGLEFESQGILRTPRCTLENYLLEPACWAEVFKRIFRRNPAAAQGWDQKQTIIETIAQSYESCLSVAAHNWVVKMIMARYRPPTTLPREYLRHYKAMDDQQGVLQSLSEWGSNVGASEDLREMFESRLSQLKQSPAEIHAQVVSGKLVLKRFIEHSPMPPKGRLHLYYYLNEYMEICHEPPADLTALIERIITHAER
ncbi:MAG TPA: DUF4435 domain-containing protein [Blastocatellia bacterium]|nr:DUF4435 domain-containing protein [Blastocatellia bacterium]